MPTISFCHVTETTDEYKYLIGGHSLIPDPKSSFMFPELVTMKKAKKWHCKGWRKMQGRNRNSYEQDSF
jgi:hypothetical protein